MNFQVQGMMLSKVSYLWKIMFYFSRTFFYFTQQNSLEVMTSVMELKVLTRTANNKQVAAHVALTSGTDVNVALTVKSFPVAQLTLNPV